MAEPTVAPRTATRPVPTALSRAGIRGRVVALATGGVALVAGLTGCSNGVEAGTLDPPSITGAVADVGELRVRNAVVVSGQDGGATFSLTVVNTGATDDAMTGVEITGEEPVTASLRPNQLELPARSATVVPVPGEALPTISAEADLAPGTYVSVTLQFEDAGSVDLALPVVEEDNPHAGTTDSP